MQSMTLEEEWLSQILSEQTRKSYQRSLRYFEEFLELKSTDDIISLRKNERNFEARIIQFYQWLQKDKEVSSNTARNLIIALQSLFTYAGIPIRVQKKLPRLHMKIESWKPTIEDLQKLYKFSDLPARAWISLSRDVPARISDLLKMTTEQIQSGEFVFQSKKENVIGKCYVSESTKTLFNQLDKANIKLPKTQRGIDKMIGKACQIAELPRRINQHLWRKIFISTAINLGIQDTIVKVLTSKSVPPDMLTYFLDRNDLRDSWLKVVNALPLEPKANGRVTAVEQELSNLKEALTSVEKENMVSKTRIDNLQKTTMELEGRVKEYGEWLNNWIEFSKTMDEEEKTLMKS